MVKADCPTCVLVAPVLTELAGRGVVRAVMSQDDPAFPAPADWVIDDRSLEASLALDIDTVPTLVELRDGQVVRRLAGWSRADWRAASPSRRALLRASTSAAAPAALAPSATCAPSLCALCLRASRRSLIVVRTYFCHSNPSSRFFQRNMRLHPQVTGRAGSPTIPAAHPTNASTGESSTDDPVRVM